MLGHMYLVENLRDDHLIDKILNNVPTTILVARGGYREHYDTSANGRVL
jgi:hypothetical protein